MEWKENKYWARTVIWDETYYINPSWRKIPIILCRCDCWVEKYVQKWHLLSWATKSCWCLKRDTCAEMGKQNKKHWLRRDSIYAKYQWIKARCERSGCHWYHNYGERWIKCLRDSFEDFYNDMGPSYEEHVRQFWKQDTTIERIDVNWDYCKENCKRVTREEQYMNKRNNHQIVYLWQTFPSIAALARATGVADSVLRYRINAWRDVEDAVNLPHNFRNYEQRKISREGEDDNTSYRLKKTSQTSEYPRKI